MSTHGRHIVNNLAQSINRKMHTPRGRNVLSYLLCFLVAFLFWLFITLDDITERYYELKVELEQVPDSVVVLDDTPPSINVLMKGRGTQFLKYYFVSPPALQLDYRQYASSVSDQINISRTKLDSRIREIFGQNVNIILVSPDSINLRYTTGKGVRVPLRVQSNITTSPECILAGPPEANVDSVTVYLAKKSGRIRPKYAETDLLSLDDISDTTTVMVNIQQLPNMRIVPEKVKVTVPVEMLVAKTATLPVSVVNVAEGERVLTYPASVIVHYLVPMRMSSTPLRAKAQVDYRRIRSGASRAGVSLTNLPEGIHIVSLSHDSVEYVIER